MTNALLDKLLSLTTDQGEIELLRRLKTFIRLDIASAYNKGWKVGKVIGQSEVREKILKRGAGMN